MPSQLTGMTVGENTLYFSYDANGLPFKLTYNSAVYYYVTNLQGDVVAIVDCYGDVVVEYTYDAWGNVLSSTGLFVNTVSANNPLRYRGYVYDPETGLYWCKLSVTCS